MKKAKSIKPAQTFDLGTDDEGLAIATEGERAGVTMTFRVTCTRGRDLLFETLPALGVNWV